MSARSFALLIACFASLPSFAQPALPTAHAFGPDTRRTTYGNPMQLDATDTLRLEITNVDSPYSAPGRVPSVTRVPDVKLEVPAQRP